MDYAVGPAPQGGDRNRASEILAIDGVIFSISWSMVFLRVCTRMWITRNLGWDDATIVLAAITNSVGLGLYVSMILYGLGRHKYYLSDYDVKELRKYDFLDWIQTFITLAVSKISICLLLLRLAKFDKLKAALHTLIGFLVATHLPLILLYIFQCSPVSKAWNTALDGKCFSKNAVLRILIAQGVFSILTDFIGAAFPIVLLWNVKIRTKKKIAIWLLMGFGVITGVTCIVRTSLSYHIKSQDLTWDAVGIAISKCLEVNFGIMAACLPIMKPFYAYFHSLYTGTPTTLGRRGRHHRPSHTQSTFSSNSNSHQGLWHRLRSLRSTRTTLPLPDMNNNNNDNIELNLVEEGMDDLPANAERAKRSVLTMPERARDRESGVGTDLPIQGAIEKKVEFGYEEGFRPAGGKEKRREYWG